MVRQVTATEAKTKLLALLDEVETGESIEITRRGHLVARMAWLAEHERIVTSVPIRTWLSGLAGHVRSVANTPAIAATAVSLRSTFPADLADRLIYATAIECGWQIVTKDRRMHEYPGPRSMAVW